MSWLIVVTGALGGGIVATLLEDSLRRRRAYRTALLLIRAELSRNATWIDQGKQPRARVFADKIFAPGRIRTAAWDANHPALAGRLWRKRHALWAELNAVYTTLEAFSATGEEPPSGLVAELRSLEQRLGAADPTWLEVVVVFLATHGPTKRVGVAIATRLSRHA
jgi:hypothetical protein